jgi:DNA repair protein RecN (Recombination protein N)
LNAAVDQITESVRDLRDYLDGLEADPDALEQTVERLFRIGDLKRKYGESVAEVLAYAEHARERLGEIESRAERLDALAARVSVLEDALQVAAEALSRRRRDAAVRLADAVHAELADLRLAEAAFGIGLDAGEIELTGCDRVQFRMGEDARAVARVASGGELARIALALKTVLSQAETRASLIFDEVDVGIGGRTAPVVGQKLWSVAASGHQVLCVTHMPQVAAYADTHFVVSRTSGAVCVTQVEGEQRIDELAAMLGGTVTEAARQSARELLERAAVSKSKRRTV